MHAALGLNLHHDTSACLIAGGRIVAAEEERWSGVKHNRTDRSDYLSFPVNALRYCLEAAGLELDSISSVWSVSMSARDPLRHWLEPEHAPERAVLPPTLRERTRFLGHHTAHIMAGFATSPFERAVGLCMDGGGSAFGWDIRGRERVTGYDLTSSKLLRVLQQLPAHAAAGDAAEVVESSLGHWYRNLAVTCVPPGDEPEGSAMALAAYGDPDRFYAELRRLVTLRRDGVVAIAPPLGSYAVGRSFRIGGLEWSAASVHDKPLELRAALAAAAQRVFEEAVVHVARHLRKVTGCRQLVFSGGCALNAQLNSRLAERAGYDDLYVAPAPHDGGTALGAGLFGWCHELGQPRPPSPSDADWGPPPGNFQTQRSSGASDLPDERLYDEVAKLLAASRMVGWARGGMEFGPRALGHRSILAHPGSAAIRDAINRAKRRADFRPLAPSVLRARAGDWFAGGGDPFMNRTAIVKPHRRNSLAAVTHVDGTARLQIVSEDGALHGLLMAFERRTGLPCLLNTSLNFKGKPIARTASQAVEIFDQLRLDALVVGNTLVVRDDLPA
jgi:carbamoyltransferase